MGQRSSAEHRDLSALAPELSQSLLAWWEGHGRKDPALKPWMFTKDGKWPEPHEHLNVLVCWIAEEDWKAIQETLYLTSIPGMRESILEGMAAPESALSETPGW